MALTLKKQKAPSFEERIAQADRARTHGLTLAETAAGILASAAVAQDGIYTELDNEIGRLMDLQLDVSNKQYGNERLSNVLTSSLAN